MHPRPREIFQIYALIVWLVYTWTAVVFLSQLGALVAMLDIGDVLSVLAYAFSYDFFEILLILLILLGAVAILPARYLRDKFVLSGSCILAITASWAILFQLSYLDFTRLLPGQMLGWVGLSLASLGGALILAPRVPRLDEICMDIAERATIFPYIYVPASLISLLVVLARNLI